MTPPAPGSGRWSGAQFEAEVWRVFRDTVLAYCGRARLDSRVDPGLRMRIMVITAAPLTPSLCAQMNTFAEHTVRVDLPAARLDSLTFPLSPVIDEPGYRVDIAPELPGYSTDPGGHRHPPTRFVPGRVAARGPDLTIPEPEGDQTRPSASPEESSSTTLLVTYDTKLSFPFPLFASELWLPMGRDLPVDLRVPALRIALHVTAIPRGALLEVRYLRGEVYLRRTRSRHDCGVKVDGIPLRHGDSVALGEAGRIDYLLSSAAPSVLSYQLRRKE